MKYFDMVINETSVRYFTIGVFVVGMVYGYGMVFGLIS